VVNSTDSWIVNRHSGSSHEKEGSNGAERVAKTEQWHAAEMEWFMGEMGRSWRATGLGKARLQKAAKF
jgi:hypothetical protein